MRNDWFRTALGGLWVVALLAVMLAAMAGCAARPEPVRPIPTPCVTQDQIPPEVPPVGVLPEDARQASDVLGALGLALRANERIMRALLRGCVS